MMPAMAPHKTFEPTLARGCAFPPAPGFPGLLALSLLLMAGPLALAGERLTLNFNPDWRFLKADPPGASRTDFNDSQWTTVSAPHTFNDTEAFNEWSPLGHVGQTNQWSGRTWYRKSFTLPEDFKGRRVYLEFEAVRQVAEVYLNGQPLGTNRTGFIPFGFDLTPHLQFGGATNVLAVMADNRFTLETELARIAATDLPWNSPHWHPAHGGIYRNVYLHVTDPLHITLPLYSSLKTAGPYVYATDISEQAATVHCEVPVQNGRPETEDVTARVEVFDREGKSVLLLEEAKPVAAGAQETFLVSGKLTAPQLWEPGYPYLYKAVCTLSARGQAGDSCAVPLGIRQVRWDVKTGFYINGHHLKLRGWGQRPTSEWPGLGAAQPDWMHHYTLALMKEAGGNFVRWGHCAGAPADITSADQLGLLTLQPGVDGEGDAQGEAWTLRAAAFRDMLVYYRNHPSIIIWEGGNQKVTREHAKELRAHEEAWDPHGGRAFAHRRADETTGAFMDVDLGTEGGRQVPRLPLVEAEYDREESPRRVWDDFSPPSFGYPEAKGQTYQLTSEQYAVNQVSQWMTKLGQPWHCGGANWIFSDSTSGGRVGCEVARTGGEVDGVRLPKEAYFVLRSMWRNEPQAHIIGHWTYPAGTKKTVYVTSNCGEVELLLNGKSLGRGAVSNRYLFAFTNIAWEAGELKAIAYRDGKPAATQAKHTVGAPVALRLTPRLGPGGFLADGADVALVDVEAVDVRGERCPTFQQRVDFDLAGPGVWRGGYNSGKAHSINNRFLDLECGVNRVAVRSTPVPGAITLTARCGDLKPATLTLTSACVMVEHGSSVALPALPPPPALNRSISEDLLIQAQAAPQPSPGRFLKTFSYSGPTGTVQVRQDAKDGEKIYADREFVFTALPAPLKGSDWVQAANADKLYSAVDLMELAASVEGVVYVAHDGRLPRPDWLQRLFKPTDLRLSVNGQSMNVFERHVRGGESLTLGSNTEDRRLKASNMYIIFVNRAEGSSRASL
jgi:beta-galactosidase